jgi:opacity protein-like surface antigen
VNSRLARLRKPARGGGSTLGEGRASGRGRPFHYFILPEAVAQKVHQRWAGALICSPKATASGGWPVKKLFVASVAIAAAAWSGAALAADLPPVPMAAPIVLGFDWEGFYVGGHVGGVTDSLSFTQNDVSWVTPLFSTSVNTGETGNLGSSNVTGGIQIGYNWMLPGPYLFGLEADISGTGLSSTVVTSPPGDPFAVAQWNDRTELYGSARARFGYISGNWLFYGTGGFGWDLDKFTRTQLTAVLLDPSAPEAGTVITKSSLRAGWVAGAGVEWAFARTWTVKLEYLHFDTQSETDTGSRFNFIAGGGGAVSQTSTSVATTTSNLTLDTVRVGINHTFN